MIRRAQPWLGTMVEIGIADIDGDPVRLAAAFAAGFTAVALVHRLMSFHDANSDVSAINRLAVGAHCTVDLHTATVLRCARRIEDASDGRFNIACADRLEAWGYLPANGKQSHTAAANARVGAAAQACLPRAVLNVGDDCTVTRMRQGGIDLGGIAKGHAVDLAVEALLAAGVSGGCVNAGGDLRAFGDAAIAVTVRDPVHPTQAGRQLMLSRQALATSACYFSRRLQDGISRSALIDGRDGTPVLHRRSASVLAPTCMLADGLTKLVMASGDAAHPVLAQFGATAFMI